MEWREHIESSQDVLSGKPCIKETRIPVSLILGYLAEGHTKDEIIEELSDLTRVEIQATLAYAKELSEFETAVKHSMTLIFFVDHCVPESFAEAQEQNAIQATLNGKR